MAKDHDWLEIIDELHENPPSDSEELILGSLAISELELVLDQGKEEDPIVIEKLDSLGLMSSNPDEKNKNGYSLKDPYYDRLDRGSFERFQALLKKIRILSELHSENSEWKPYLREFVDLGPKFSPQEYADVAALYLSRQSFHPLENSERWKELLEFLVYKRIGKFQNAYLEITGSNINVRSGPGTENEIVGSLNQGQIGFLLDESNRKETIGGNTGNWKLLYSPGLQKSVWVFSPFVQPANLPSQEMSAVLERFQYEEEIWDFEVWDPATGPPPGFLGPTLSFSQSISDGEKGIVLKSAKTGSETDRICRKLPNKLRSIRFRVFHKEGSQKIPLFSVLDQNDSLHRPLFEISVDSNSVYINRNRYMFEGGTALRELEIRWTEEGNSVDLLENSQPLVTGVRANREKESQSESNLYFCISKPRRAGDSQAELYRIHIEKH